MERSYKDLKQCELCHKDFSFIRVRHKCKRCNLIICSDCGKSKSMIIGYKDAPETPHRVCNICNDDIKFQREVIKTFTTSWNKLSQQGKTWLSLTNAYVALSMNPQTSYEQYLEKSDLIPEILNTINDLTDDIKQGRADRESFNYSMTEFIHYAQLGMTKTNLHKSVENVLRAFYVRYPNQGYVSLLINIAMFLLCFTDENSAFALLCFINEKIVPENFWNVNSPLISLSGLWKEKYVIERASRNILNTLHPKINLKPFEITYRKISTLLIGGLLADVVNFNTLYFTWDNMFKQKSFKPIETTVLKIIKSSKIYFDEFHEMSLYNYRIFICRSVQSTSIKADQTAPISVEDKQRFEQDFDTKELPDTLARQDRLINSMDLLKELSQDDLNAVLAKISEMKRVKSAEKKLKVEYLALTKEMFVIALREAPYLSEVKQNILNNIFDAVDINKEGTVNSRVFCGFLILLVSNNLKTKLANIFLLFDKSGEGILLNAEMPNVVDFLADVLPIMGEANPSYTNFYVHLYEMLEKLKKKVKSMEKVTSQDFLQIAKYPVFTIVTGHSGMKRMNTTISFLSMNDSNIGEDSDSLPENDRNIDELDLLGDEIIGQGGDDVAEEDEHNIKKMQKFQENEERADKEDSKELKSEIGSKINFLEELHQSEIKKVEPIQPRKTSNIEKVQITVQAPVVKEQASAIVVDKKKIEYKKDTSPTDFEIVKDDEQKQGSDDQNVIVVSSSSESESDGSKESKEVVQEVQHKIENQKENDAVQVKEQLNFSAQNKTSTQSIKSVTSVKEEGSVDQEQVGNLRAVSTSQDHSGLLSVLSAQDSTSLFPSAIIESGNTSLFPTTNPQTKSMNPITTTTSENTGLFPIEAVQSESTSLFPSTTVQKDESLLQSVQNQQGDASLFPSIKAEQESTSLFPTIQNDNALFPSVFADQDTAIFPSLLKEPNESNSLFPTLQREDDLNMSGSVREDKIVDETLDESDLYSLNNSQIDDPTTIKRKIDPNEKNTEKDDKVNPSEAEDSCKMCNIF